MSKRGADVQGGRDGWFVNPNGTPSTGMDTPRRATAAQMAHRKIVHNRTTRRPGNIGGQSNYNPPEHQQQMVNPFSNIDPNILSNNASTNVDEQVPQTGPSSALQNGVPGGNMFGASLSFPQNSPLGAQSGNLSASFSGFSAGKVTSTTSSTPPASKFSFTSSITMNNPFVPRKGTDGYAGKSNEFRPLAHPDEIALFAPISPEIMGKSSSQSDTNTQPESTSITAAKSSDIVQTPTATKLFGQTPVQQDKPSPATTDVSLPSAEKMQISPDITSAKVDVPKAGAFSFLSQTQKDPSTAVNTQPGLFPTISQPPLTPNPTHTNTDADASTENKKMFSASSRRVAPLKSAMAAPKTIDTKGLFSGLLMPPSAQSPLASKQQPRATTATPFSGSFNPPKHAISTQAPLSTAETPIQKDKLTNGVNGHASVTKATGASQTSNIFRDIVGNSKTPVVEVQKEKLTNGVNGVNGVTPVSQTSKMPTESSTFGNNSEKSKIPDSNKGDRFMGMPPPAPAHFTDDQKREYVTLYRIRSLDISFQKHIMSMTEFKPGDIEQAIRFYTETHEKILASGDLPLEGITGNKRKFTSDEAPGESGSPAKKSKPEQVKIPTLQTNGAQSSSNMFNNLPGKPGAAVTNNSSNEAGVAKPPKFSLPTFQPPTSGAGKPVNFLAQFGQSVAETERKEKAKRKAEDFDSDEDDEAEWERKDAEEQRAKKQKLLEAAKGKVTKFVPGKGFAIEEEEKSMGGPANGKGPVIDEDEQSKGGPSNATKPPVSNGVGLFGSTTFKPSTAGGASVFDSAKQAISSPNIFGHLTEKQPANGTTPGTPNIFGHLTEKQPANGTTPGTPNIFGHLTEKQPANGTTPGTPNIFGHLTEKQPANGTTPGKSLFDRISKDENGNNIRELPAPSASNIFGSAPNKSVIGFGFGGPPKSATSSLLVPSTTTSAASSRATSPGITTDTGGESTNESSAEGAEAEKTDKAQQINLTTGGPGEEEEEVLFEVRAKAMMWLAEAKDEQTAGGWQNKGIGPFRVLKHRQTGKARIVMRLDPSGRLVLNAALLEGVTYQHQAPATVKMAVASEGGKLNTWIIKVKMDEDAVKLADILEESKCQ